MNKTFWVALREFKATVFTRAFILGFFLPPILMFGAVSLIPLLMNKSAPKVTGHIAVIDRAGAVSEKLSAAFEPQAVRERREAALKRGLDQAPIPDALKQQAAGQAQVAASMVTTPELRVLTLPPESDTETEKSPILAASGKEKNAGGADPRLALVVVPADAVRPPEGQDFASFEYFVAPKLDFEIQQDIERQVNRAIVDARIEARGLEVKTIRDLTRTQDVKAIAVTKEGERSSGEVAKLLVPGAFMILLWISVFAAGQYLLTSTIEEKSSRVMEVLLSAVSPFQLLVGKIIGQMAVGLLILIAYAGLGIGGLIVASMTHLVDPMNIVYLGIFFLLAFAMIACLMAAVGSAVSDIREAQSLMAPVMIVLVIPMMLWMPIIRNPNSLFAQVCSFVPPISPFVMVLRLSGSEAIPAWQIPASIVVGLIAVCVMAWAAAKVFRVGVLMYGKPPNFATLLRWIRLA